MKKLISLFVIAAMICCMAVTAFAAAPTVSAVVTPAEVVVGEATAVVNLKVTFEEAGDLAMIGMTVVVPEGLVLKDVDYSEFTAKCEKVTNDCVFEDGLVVVYDDDMEVAFTAGESVNFKLNFEITDPSVAGVYDISFEDVAFQNYDEEVLVGDIANTTITVKADEPKESVDTLTAKTDITIDGQKWTGIALYEASFDLDTVVDGAKAYGIRVGEDAIVSSINGNGTVDFVLAYYGDAAANVGTVEAFWTAK